MGDDLPHIAVLESTPACRDGSG